MSETHQHHPIHSQAPQPLRTRAPAPTPRRLSRKALALASGAIATGIAGALLVSFSEAKRGPPPEEVAVERGGHDLLESAPKDYEDLARRGAAGIGPPPTTGTAPADPSATATPTTQASATAPAPANSTQADSEAQRRRQQGEAARASKLFASDGVRQSAGSPPTGDPDPTAVSQSEEEAATKPQTDRHPRQAAFLTNSKAEPTVNGGRSTAPPGANVIMAGSTISAALLTGLSSDLPGQVVAQVTENVFDSITGNTRLIPQGARLIGNYDADVAFGQSRALVVWTRLIFPDGRSIDLDKFRATDAGGQSGLADKVNNHWGNMFRAGLLSTLLGIGAAASELDNGEIANAIRDSAGQTIGRAGDRIVEKQLNVQPTITVRPGARVKVLVSRDLVLEPWRPD